MKRIIIVFFIATLPSFAQENWKYSSDFNKMSEQKTFFAECISKDNIDFRLLVRHQPYEINDGAYSNQYDFRNEILLIANNYIFELPTGDLKTIKIRFDNSPPIEWYVNGASNSNYDAIFFKFEKKLIKKLINSKSLLIEAEFFRIGKKVIEFDIEGLKWQH